MKWFSTLKLRLIASFMALVMLTITIIAWYIVVHQRDVVEQHVRQELTALTDLLVTNSLTPILFDDSVSAQQNLLSLRVRPDIPEAVIFNAQGEPFARYTREGQIETAMPEWLKNRINTDQLAVHEDEAGMHAVAPMISHGEQVGSLYIRNDLATSKHQLSQFYRLVVMTAIIAVVISFLATLWLVSMFITPMADLLATMRDIGHHRDYSRRAPKATTKEFNQLADSFNQMIGEIAVRDQQLEQLNTELEHRVKARTEALETALALANEASHAKAEFLAVMSHEVRTPLNGVIGFAELLKMQELDEDSQHLVVQLNASAKILLTLLNDILDFSKLDANKLELDQQPIEIPSFIHSLVETHRAKADRKLLQLSVEIKHCRGYYLGDQLRLGQILNNLIDNAIKFTREGAVVITAHQQRRQDQNWVEFKVKDTGMGVSVDNQETIFSPFSQADKAVTRKFGGTGLGLAICAQLIQLMQGEYGVESMDGRGSVFWFRIPMTPFVDTAKATTVTEVVEHIISVEGKEILLVEDNEVNQAVAAAMLKNLGCLVDIAANGRHAITQCQHKQYDLILMDYHMPEMDGLEATEKIRQTDPTNLNQATPIIALTADVQNHVQTSFRQAGANDFLVKPFSFKRLEEMLGHWTTADPLVQAELETAQKRVIDDAVFDEIRAMSGSHADGLIRNIVEIYLQKSPSLIDDIHQGTHQGDADRLFRAAHALKSSSANVGALKVSAIAKEMEKMARANTFEPARLLLERLSESYSQAEQSLRGRLGEA